MNDDIGIHLLETITAEYRKHKQQADRAVAQIGDVAFFARLDEESNSIALLMKHLAGNLKSRWTDFLTSDGEKADRDRDSEFEDREDTRGSIVDAWDEGWRRVFTGLESLAPGDLLRRVTIRDEPHTVVQAVMRNITHTAGHVSQIVMLAKHYAGPNWQTLSIPKKK